MDKLQILLQEYKILGCGYRLAAEKYTCITTGLKIPADVCIALVTGVGTYEILKSITGFEYCVTGLGILALIFRTLSLSLSYESKRDEFIKAAEYYEDKVLKVTKYINTLDATTIEEKLIKLGLDDGYTPPLLPTSFEKEARDSVTNTV